MSLCRTRSNFVLSAYKKMCKHLSKARNVQFKTALVTFTSTLLAKTSALVLSKGNETEANTPPFLEKDIAKSKSYSRRGQVDGQSCYKKGWKTWDYSTYL
jgi:hypothetical protein